MALIVLVHGAWGTPEELAPLEPALTAAGHDVRLVDLPCTDPDATFDEYAASVIAELGPPEADADTLLVGHSFGGATIGLVRERRPDVALAYVTAVALEPGQSLLESLLGADPFDDPDVDDPWASLGGLVLDAGPGLTRVDADLLAAAANDADRDRVRAGLEGTLREQGIAVMREGWPGTSRPSGRVSYIVATADTIVPPELQRQTAAALEADVYEIFSDHVVPVERPDELAAILADIADNLTSP